MPESLPLEVQARVDELTAGIKRGIHEHFGEKVIVMARKAQKAKRKSAKVMAKKMASKTKIKRKSKGVDAVLLGRLR